MSKNIWLTWEHQRRNRSMANALSIPIYEIISTQSRLLRYFSLIFRTARVLLSEKPDVLFVQNPSIVLAFFSVMTKRLFGIRAVVVDAHNGGIFPMEGRSRFLNAIALLLIRYADLTIVTNDNLKCYIERRKGRAVVIPDPLPEFDLKISKRAQSLVKGESKIRITYVCTWAADEPYLKVISAAAKLPSHVHVSITGRPPKNLQCNLSENITLTGFIDEKSYVELLASSHLVMVLTSREDCLNCGAYEAVALNKPMILSDTAVIRSYFNKGVVYSELSDAQIYSAICSAIKDYDLLSAQVVSLRAELLASWIGFLEPLRKFLLL